MMTLGVINNDCFICIEVETAKRNEAERRDMETEAEHRRMDMEQKRQQQQQQADMNYRSKIKYPQVNILFSFLCENLKFFSISFFKENMLFFFKCWDFSLIVVFMIIYYFNWLWATE